MEINYDRVLVNGSASELFRFADENGVFVDWRDEEDSLVRYFAGKLEDENLSAEYTDKGLMVTYNGIDYEVPLTFSPKDRYVAIRGLMNILKDKYEIRIFENSLGSDTHAFYIKPKEWWAYMDKNFPEAISKVFYEIDDELDFGAGLDRIYVHGPGK